MLQLIKPKNMKFFFRIIKLTTALVPQSTGVVNVVTKHDRSRYCTQQSDEDVLQTQSQGPLLLPDTPQRGHGGGHGDPECEEDEDEGDDDEGYEDSTLIVTLLSDC